MCMQSRNTLALTEAEKSMTEIYEIYGRERERKNGQIMGMISSRRCLYSNTQYSLSYLMFVSNFKILGIVALAKSLTKIYPFITFE